MSTTVYVQVITTLGTHAEALALARRLIEARQAACVQIVGPVTSVYRWEGELEEDEEWQCWIKTRSDLLPALMAVVQAAHPYQVPEILALPVLDGHAPYFAWLDEQVGPGL